MTTTAFYGDVVQQLSPWKARPAKLRGHVEQEEPPLEQLSEDHPPLVEPIIEARLERLDEGGRAEDASDEQAVDLAEAKKDDS